MHSLTPQKKRDENWTWNNWIVKLRTFLDRQNVYKTRCLFKNFRHFLGLAVWQVSTFQRNWLNRKQMVRNFHGQSHVLLKTWCFFIGAPYLPLRNTNCQSWWRSLNFTVQGARNTIGSTPEFGRWFASLGSCAPLPVLKGSLNSVRTWPENGSNQPLVWAMTVGKVCCNQETQEPFEKLHLRMEQVPYKLTLWTLCFSKSLTSRNLRSTCSTQTWKVRTKSKITCRNWIDLNISRIIQYLS